MTYLTEEDPKENDTWENRQDTLLHNRYSNGQEMYDKVPNLDRYQRNASQNH